jgi:NAD(P)-dependent dehydrogenase (short-subunit alcohol dehydrogenase family)
MGLVEGRLAVVTGGAGVIASAVCRLFTEEGARVLFADVDAERTTALQRELAEAGHTAEGVVADLRDASAMTALRERADELGGADILVNALGHYLSIGPFVDNDDDLWRALWDINVLPVLRACHLFVPGMRERKWGRVITFSSVEAIRSAPFMAVYGACKAAVDSFSKSLAVEVARDNVLVNAIASDKTRTIQTNFLQIPPEYGHLVPSWIPRGRYGEGVDNARIALFLASDLADWIVGSTLLADGGTIAAGGWYRTPARWTTQPLLHQYFEPPEANDERPRSLQ